jgi:hypothetical protein
MLALEAGKAAVVLPNNVLFENGSEEAICKQPDEGIKNLKILLLAIMKDSGA